MIRNELIKFFRLSNTILYIVILTLVTVLFGVAINQNYKGSYDYKSIEYMSNIINKEVIYYLLPLFCIFFLATIFTKDIYEGKLKFFLIGKDNKISILISKMFISIITMSLLVIVVNILSVVATVLLSGEFDKLKDYISIIDFNKIVTTIYLFIPLLMIFIFISINSRNSIIIAISLFFLFIATEQVLPNIADCMPTGIIKLYLYNGQFKFFNTIIPSIILTIVNIIVFYRKDMVE